MIKDVFIRFSVMAVSVGAEPTPEGVR
jgi:hypothetical protein